MHIFRLFLLFLVLNLSLSLFINAKTMSDGGLYRIPEGDSWYKLRFQTAINENSKGLRIHLHKNAEDLVGTTLGEVFRPVPAWLSRVLTAPNTENPFKDNFKYIYTPENIQKRLSCHTYGVRLDVDNQPVTREWLLIFSSKKCFGKDHYGTDSLPHQWLLQQTENGQFKILMEAENQFSSITSIVSEDGYKQIENTIHIVRAMPESSLECGKALLTWEYKNGQYEVIQKRFALNHCLTKHPDPGKAKWKREKKLSAEVQVMVNDWLERITTSKQIADSTNTESVLSQELLDSGLLSNSYRKKAVMAPAFSVEEQKAIERIFQD